MSRSFKIFESSIRSKKTLAIYAHSLNVFLKFCNISEYDELLKLDTDAIQEKLENWIISMKEKGLKGTTIKNKISAVSLFLDMNRKMYFKKILRKMIPLDEMVCGGDVPITGEEIKRMLECTTKLRTKALVHFFASTGIRPGAMVDPIMKIKHLAEMPNDCMAIRVYDNSKEGYWAFLTPEATRALNDCIRYRRINGENITPESPLFVTADSRETRPLAVDTAYAILQNLYAMAGIERKKTGFRYDKALAYGFRKRFNTILKINNNVNSNIAEKLMGHKNGLDGTYLKPTIEECFREFQKAISDLMIDDSRKLFEQKRIEVEDMKKSYSEKDVEIIKLRKEVEELRKITEPILQLFGKALH